MEHAHDLTLFVAAGVIAVAPFAATAMERYRGWTFLARESHVRADVALWYGLALLSLGAGVIHVAVVADHYAEGVIAGLLMAATAGFQLLWIATRSIAPRRLHELSGFAVNAGVILAWIASRTIGLPSPIGDGHVEPIGALDLLATSFELGIVVGLGALLLRREHFQTWAISARSASLAVLALGAAVVVLATASIVTGPPHVH